MASPLRKFFIALALFALALQVQAGPRPPLEDFFAKPAFTGAALSPSGKYLAVRFGANGSRQRLAVIDLSTRSAQQVAAFDDSDVGDFQWINDERLVFNSDDRHIGIANQRLGPGLFAVNRDGKNFRQLIAITFASAGLDKLYNVELQPYNSHLLHVNAKKDSNSVWIARRNYRGEVDSTEVLKLNTLTGHASLVKRPARHGAWMFDQDGEPRLVLEQVENMQVLHYRDPAMDNEWRKLVSFDAYKGKKMLNPVGFGPDGALYVSAVGDGDKQALYKFDVKTAELAPEPLLNLKDFDFRGSLVVRDKVMGIHYAADAPSTFWFDPKMKQVQEKIDALLPSTVNMLSIAQRPETPWVLVLSESDRQPLVIRVYNTETGALDVIGTAFPKIDPRAMGRTQFVKYKARDGMEIPGWLTIPAGTDGKNLPMVVLVHGGPWVSGRTWDWNPEVQFLASRGYAVLEPDFRGTLGYGSKHYQSSFKQWGLKMQDDVADGTRWAIAKGVADPQRICIMGGSYGGYATLMGLVNDPDLYKCGINMVGVTDINLMYNGHWSASSDMSSEWKKYGMPEMIGDQVKDAAQLKATSPIEQAARIKAPLLLAYGGADERVPIYHGRKFHDAVIQTNKDVEWVVYEDEGHGFRVEKNSLDFYNRVEKFLDRNIGQKK
ncbi:alpha/beta fold hydrolase [Pseudoduganella sp. GCM10020061]|uniref:alpha/beta hydrolase family protein n=1 Tax=Pseudoduganella sp. GCM10020061 TaxID=3317345 RepID=UPI003641C303